MSPTAAPRPAWWDVANRANLLAGLTVCAYLVPQVMAYATVAGLPPSAGLWACLPALVLYAILGTSRLLSVGPESSVALMTAAVVGPMVAGDPDAYAATAAALALAVAAVLFLASLLRLAFIADLLSRPVLVGYLSGIAVLMIVGQLSPLLGIDVDGDSVLTEITSALGQLADINIASLAIGVTVIVAVFVLSRWPRLPGPLLAIIAVGALAAIAGLPVDRVGEIPRGLPVPELPQVDPGTLGPLLVGALGVSVVAFTDTTLTARAFRVRTDPEIAPTLELRALAAANAGAGLLQGMAVSSSGSRTALAKAGAATSQGYSIVAAVFLSVVLLVAGPLLSGLPRAALAGLVVYAAIRLFDLDELRRLWHFRRMEFALAAFTFFGVLVLGVLYGVVAAVAVSVLEMLARVARPHAAAIGVVPGLAGMHDIDDFPTAREEPGLLVYRYDSPLFFANAENFRRIALELVEERQPGLRWVALNCEAIVEIDSTAVDALDELRRFLDDEGIRLVLVRAKRELVEALEPAGLIDRIGREYIFPTLPTLVAAFREQEGAGGRQG
jgi:high affinity sulfate transporter 1